jgi:hypothetical protein
MDIIKHEQEEDQQAFLPKTDEDFLFSDRGARKAISAWKSYMRLILEIMMAFVIVILFICTLSNRKTGKPSPVPRCMFVACDLVTNEEVIVANMKLQKSH